LAEANASATPRIAFEPDDSSVAVPWDARTVRPMGRNLGACDRVGEREALAAMS
jgi:hypothetical protein